MQIPMPTWYRQKEPPSAQLELCLYPETLDVDGMRDERGDITYIGRAHQENDGTWRCLANVGGALCLVQVKVRRLP